MLVLQIMLAAYGITKRQLHSDALANSKDIFPANIISLEKLLSIPKEMMVTNASDIFVVTNTQTVNGASVLFYQGMMGEIARIVGGSFYAIPSSIHEFLVFAKKKCYHSRRTEINHSGSKQHLSGSG